MSAGGPGFYGVEHAPFVIEADPSQPDFEVKDLAQVEGLSASPEHEAVRVAEVEPQQPDSNEFVEQGSPFDMFNPPTEETSQASYTFELAVEPD